MLLRLACRILATQLSPSPSYADGANDWRLPSQDAVISGASSSWTGSSDHELQPLTWSTKRVPGTERLTMLVLQRACALGELGLKDTLLRHMHGTTAAL